VEEGSGVAFVRRVAVGVESWEVQALMLGLMFLDLLATMALCVADQVGRRLGTQSGEIGGDTRFAS
jgi:hypothetical protein